MTADDRDWLERQFAQLRDALQAHVLQDETRLTKLEEWRRSETANQIRRGTWAGIVAAAGLSGLWEVVKWWTHK